MSNEVRGSVQLQVNGQEVPGFEGGLRFRTICDTLAPFSLTLPAPFAAAENPGTQSVDVSRVTAIRVLSGNLIVYLGENHSEGISIGPGGGILIWGAAGKVAGPDLANTSEDTQVEIAGIVGGD